ncbi:MAG TPA: type II toxin-antitoxin system PemK/MazF family toxin [Gemmata sp.]|nr:type II toxin-antitoxin system PemK/MazF family toxin [Gemmata sp.]
MTFARGDVVIALFPNADGSPPKARPVLVVQADTYNAKLKNLIVAAVTSNLTHAADAASLFVEVNTPDGKASGLRQDSVVSCINLATIAETLVAKKIGQLPPRADAEDQQLPEGRSGPAVTARPRRARTSTSTASASRSGAPASEVRRGVEWE